MDIYFEDMPLVMDFICDVVKTNYCMHSYVRCDGVYMYVRCDGVYRNVRCDGVYRYDMVCTGM